MPFRVPKREERSFARIGRFDHFDLQLITSRQEQDIANGTINRELSVLRAMFRLGERSTAANGKPVVDRLPAFPRKMKEGRPRKGFIKDEQFALPAANAKTPWLRCFIECAYKFGFRKGELLGLRKRQVDLLEGRIRLEDSKSGDPRTIVMTETMCQLTLVLLRGRKDEDYVFTREDGSRVVAPRKEWYSLCVSSGLGKYELEARKNGESYKKYAGLNPAWLQAFGTSEHDQAGSYREGGYDHLGALHTVSFRPLQHRG